MQVIMNVSTEWCNRLLCDCLLTGTRIIASMSTNSLVTKK